MATENVEARLAALEARNDKLKTLATVALVLAIVIPIAAVWGTTAYLQSKTTAMSVELDEVRAKRFVVVNADRQSRAVLEATGDEAQLHLGTAEGGRATLRAHADRATLALAAPNGARSSTWARDGVAQTVLRDGAGRDVQLGLYAAGGESWRGGLRVRGDATETRLESDGSTTALSATHEDAETGTRLTARLSVDDVEGSALDLASWDGDTLYRHAALAAPSVEARAGSEMRLDQRGSSLTAAIWGVPRINLRRGATSIWESPVPRGTVIEEEPEAPAPAAPAPTAQPAAEPATQPATAAPAAQPAAGGGGDSAGADEGS